MKKIAILTFLLCLLGGLYVFEVRGATDWDEFESGRNNIRLDGYDGQPGYIRFIDQAGNTSGFLFGSSDDNLYWIEIDDITVGTNKIGEAGLTYEKLTTQ